MQEIVEANRTVGFVEGYRAGIEAAANLVYDGAAASDDGRIDGLGISDVIRALAQAPIDALGAAP